MASLAGSIENDEPFLAEYRLQHADGRWLVFSDQGVLLTGRGRPPREHDRGHARRHPRARRGGHGA